MKRLAALMLVAALSGCGLRPLYSNGSAGATRTALAGISVAPIDGGKAGWLMHSALTQRLGGGAEQYRLTVLLDDRIEGLGIRSDDAVTRERRTLRARYALIDARGATVFEATAGSDAGIDVVGSEYGTIAAENTALERLTEIVADQITARIALYVAQSQRAAAR